MQSSNLVLLHTYHLPNGQEAEASRCVSRIAALVASKLHKASNFPETLPTYHPLGAVSGTEQSGRSLCAPARWDPRLPLARISCKRFRGRSGRPFSPPPAPPPGSFLRLAGISPCAAVDESHLCGCIVNRPRWASTVYVTTGGWLPPRWVTEVLYDGSSPSATVWRLLPRQTYSRTQQGGYLGPVVCGD